MISFECPECGKQLNVADSLGGKKGKCPGCDAPIDVPKESARTDQPKEQEPEPKKKKGITFNCPHCDRKMTVSAKLGGKQGKCPGCQKALTVPEEGEIADDAIHFPCTFCGKRIKVEKTLAGKVAQCTECGKGVLVPDESVPESDESIIDFEIEGDVEDEEKEEQASSRAGPSSGGGGKVVAIVVVVVLLAAGVGAFVMFGGGPTGNGTVDPVAGSWSPPTYAESRENSLLAVEFKGDVQSYFEFEFTSMSKKTIESFRGTVQIYDNSGKFVDDVGIDRTATIRFEKKAIVTALGPLVSADTKEKLKNPDQLKFVFRASTVGYTDGSTDEFK